MIIIEIVAAWLLAPPLSPNDPVVTCPEDAQAVAITHRLRGLPEEVQRDILRETGGLMGERPQPLRDSDVITSENEGHLTTRFYRGLLLRETWYVQIERTMTGGVYTLGYSRRANGDYHRSHAVHFHGPPCETIRAALSGVGADFWYLTN